MIDIAGRMLELNAEQEAEILRLRAENEKLRAALKPFADCSHEFDDEGNEQPIWYGTVGDLRAARAAMEGKDD